MNRPLAPIEMIRLAAEYLGDLREEVAFVGGAIVGLLLTDPAARKPRATEDVDVVIELDHGWDSMNSRTIFASLDSGTTHLALYAGS